VSLTALKVVDVEHDQTDRVVIAADLLDLGVKQPLEVAVIRETGQLIRDRPAAHLKMELDVLERECCLGSQRSQNLEVIVGERPPTARNRDHAVGALTRLERAERDGRHADRSAVRLADPAVRRCDALRFAHDVL